MNPHHLAPIRSERVALRRDKAGARGLRRLNGAVLASAILQASFFGCGPREEVLIGAGLTVAEAGAGGDAGSTGLAGKPGVSDFVLVDATTGLDLRILSEGDTIEVNRSPVTIRAVVQPLPGSVVFKVDGRTVHTESAPLWTISGADPVTGKLIAWLPSNGRIRIDAEPYLGTDGNGSRGSELQQNFIIE